MKIRHASIRNMSVKPLYLPSGKVAAIYRALFAGLKN